MACDGGGLPQGPGSAPQGNGPRVVWDIFEEPLPEIPLPNDVATWPDPSSPTGRRLNASLLVSTRFEWHARSELDELDGWGTFAPIMVSFDGELDIVELLERQGGGDNFHASDFPEHAIYVVDLETGVPALLDLNSGSFQYGAMNPDVYYENDPRGGESNILFETVEEDLDGDGVLDPGEDTDYDGVLDHPNTLDGTIDGPLDTYDDMLWFYERETNTLNLRPILPLREKRRYAVVLTDRLRGANGDPVRSPFDGRTHIQQTEDLADLPAILAEHPEFYGDLSTRGWDGIAFAWAFTTQSINGVPDTVREGLYGRGPFARLADEYPPDLALQPSRGGPGCTIDGTRLYVASGEEVQALVGEIAGTALGLDEDATAAAVASYSNLSHIVIAYFETPSFIGDPENEQLEDTFDLDYQTGRARIQREVQQIVFFIPKESPGHMQPFPTAVQMHGHGSAAFEALLTGGLVTQHGIALVAVNATGHGLELNSVFESVLRTVLGDQCLSGFADGALAGRARDLDGDNVVDSGAHYWTAYTFHIRDTVRQTLIDSMQAIRLLRSFDGTRTFAPAAMIRPRSDALVEFDGDVNGDGTVELAGDFDGNGVPDLGGPDMPYGYVGGSLGGIIGAAMTGVEPAIGSTVNVVASGGLSDVAVRTTNGAVIPAMLLRVMGPLVVTGQSDGSDESSCPAGDFSLRFLVTSLKDERRIEFACLPASELAADDLLVVRNLGNGEVGCAGTTRGQPGIFRIGVPSNDEDRYQVELYKHGRDAMHYGDCEWIAGARQPDRIINTWEAGVGACDGCGVYQRKLFETGSPLVVPTGGRGVRRQTPEVRRLLALAQIALDPADPINFARRIFLEPLRAPDVPNHDRSALIMSTAGDPNVCVATSYALARAMGVFPFLPPDAPDAYMDFRAPASFVDRYPGYVTPQDLALGYHAIEGLPRLERHPVTGNATFLADIDDLSDGRLFFDPMNPRDQLPMAMGGVAPETLAPPLRWVRQSRPMTVPDDSVWTYADGMPMSGVLNMYVHTQGIHGFDRVYEDIPFDTGQYSFNLLARYIITQGRDIPYMSDPAGHLCLEDSSCDYILP
jgi:hypothetical protein